jgi:MoxR-like ATPase
VKRGEGTNYPAEVPPFEGEALLRLAERFQMRAEAVRREVAKVIVGQDRVVEEILTALLAGGHVILEGVPGLAKTLLVNTLAATLSLDSGRIQFTPDLMPADVTGTQVITENPLTKERQFTFRKGPVFVHMLLADEINRTPPKTQAALLEAMAEGHVTVGGSRHALDHPFFVLATQNPIEQEGTYRLPEAQLDRFLLKVVVDYPSFDEEIGIVERTTGPRQASVSPILSRNEILGLQRLVRMLRVSSHIVEYATRLARRSRPSIPGHGIPGHGIPGAGGPGDGDLEAPEWVKEHIAWGAGPRAVQALILAAKARTLLQGRFSVTRGAVRDVALPVLRHRILPSFHAEAAGLTADDLVCRLLLETPAFPEKQGYDGATRRILRL